MVKYFSDTMIVTHYYIWPFKIIDMKTDNSYLCTCFMGTFLYSMVRSNHLEVIHTASSHTLLIELEK